MLDTHLLRTGHIHTKYEVSMAIYMSMRKKFKKYQSDCYLKTVSQNN